MKHALMSSKRGSNTHLIMCVVMIVNKIPVCLTLINKQTIICKKVYKYVIQLSYEKLLALKVHTGSQIC